MGRPALALEGRRFGRLVVSDQIRRVGRAVQRLCYCECGKETWQIANHLTSGHTKSCGCLLGEFKKLGLGVAARNEVLDDYKRGAVKRGLEWSLADDEFDTLTSSECFYCHRLPSTSRTPRRLNGSFTYNGIDRLDNQRGYQSSNVVACCKICNRAKSDMTYEEFTNWLHDVSEVIHGRK